MDTNVPSEAAPHAPEVDRGDTHIRSASADTSDDDSLVIDVATPDSDDDDTPHDTVGSTEHGSGGGVLSLVSKALASDVASATLARASAEESSEAPAVDRSATSCCICGEPAMYRCPGCERRTCCMTCVRTHKVDFQCTGERDVAKKVSLANFTDHQLQRDFHFLEECRKVVANADRSFPHMWRYSFKALPPPLYALRTAAKKRGVLCQITSEGMQKRDTNTSRYDRKTDTIIWHCEFRFHRYLTTSDAASNPVNEGVLPEAAFTVSTDWASERHHLGDVLAYCWATNPPLPCYHISRRYNHAARPAPTEQEETDAPETDESAAPTNSKAREKDSTAQPAECASAQEADAHAAVAAPSCSQSENGTAQGCSAEADISAHKAADAEQVPENTSDGAAPAAPIPEGIVPLNPDEVRNEFLVRQFLSAKDAVVLCKAERLGTAVKYVRLDPSQTVNECLRVLFFVNEYPVLDVIHEADLPLVTLVTEADREAIRASFKPKEKPTPGVHGVPRRKADLTEEEQHALARVPCRMHLGGQCRLGDECPYWHCTFEEVPACRSFLRAGQCAKGDRCSFRHDEAAIREARKRRRSEDAHPGGPRRATNFQRRGGGGGGRGGRGFMRGRGYGGGRTLH